MIKKYDLTYPQKDIWLVQMFNENSDINNISGILIIKDRKFDKDTYTKTINLLVKNNQSFRMRIVLEKDVPKQYFENYKFFQPEIVDLSQKSKKQIDEYLEKEYHKPMNIFEKLYEFKAIKFSDDVGAIFYRFNHIIGDAWSLIKMGTDAAKYYEDIYKKANQNYNENPDYTEFIESEKKYLQSDKYKNDKEFWQNYLSGFRDPVIIKDINKKISNESRRYIVKLNKKITSKINDFCKENRISPFVLFLTAISTYIYRTKDVNDFTIGTPILNRSNFREKNIVGMFIATVPVRIQISENEKIIDLAHDIFKNNMEIYRHQRYPYYNMIDDVNDNRSAKIDKLFGIAFSYQNARAKFGDDTNNDLKWSFNNHIQDQFEMHLVDLNDDGQFNIYYDYFVNAFSEKEIKYINSRILTIISEIINKRDITVDNVNILSENEKQQILYEFNNTDTDYPKDKSVIEIFEDNARKYPDKTAVIFNDINITYGELNSKANKLANYLVSYKNIKKGDKVALILNKSIEHIISILSILKIDATYVTIDPALPIDRIKYMIKNSSTSLVLLDSNCIEKDKIRKDFNIAIEDINSIDIEKYSDNYKLKNHDNNVPVNIVYTSGTTGIPKGVIIKNKGIVRLVKNTNYIEFKSSDKMLQASNISFDVCAFEYWGALLNALPLYLITKDYLLNPKKFEEYILKNKITIMAITSALFNQMIDFDPLMFRYVNKLLVGGDILSIKHVNRLIKMCPNVNIYDAYGPSENTTNSTTYCINKKIVKKAIPIGKPISNSYCYVLDKKNRLLPYGVEGQLCVSGDGLAEGYINNNELTNKKFINNPFKAGYRMYLTGDITYLNFDNNLVFIGRDDNQVKIRGYRVELNEIKNKILEIKSLVDDCVVIAKKDDYDLNDKKIIVFYVGKNLINKNRLNNYLKKYLPAYMIPVSYIKLDHMPLNQNGKIDNKYLEGYDINEKQNLNCKSEYQRINADQKIILNILKDILKINKISLSDNFIQLGLDSLMAVRFALRLSKKFLVDISANDIFENTTVIDIENLIKDKKSKKNDNSLENIDNTYNVDIKKIILSKDKQNKYELTSSQKGIFSQYSLAPKSLSYNIPIEIKLKANDIDINILKSAIEDTINYNTSLFTRFVIYNNQIYQKYDSKSKFKLECLEITEAEYEYVREKFNRPFNLLKELPFNIKLYKTKEYIYVLMNFHHIIFDGASTRILLNEMNKNYNYKLSNAKNLDIDININKNTDDKLFFGQVSLIDKMLKKTNEYKEAKKYFINNLSGQLPVNTFIANRFRPNKKVYNGNIYEINLNKNLTDKINNYCKNNKLTLNTLFLAIFNVLVSKYSFNDDVLIGIANSGRGYIEELNTIGMFVKTIPYRTNINYDSSIKDYLTNTQKHVLDSIKNSIYPYEELVKDLNFKRDPSRNPLFDIMFVCQEKVSENYYLKDTKLKINNLSAKCSKFDLTCNVLPFDNKINISFEYCTKIFNKSQIKRISVSYLNLLNYFLNNPVDNKLSDVQIINEEQKIEIFDKFNNTKSDYPINETVNSIFEKNAIKYASKKAVVYENSYLTYGELNRRANQLAHELLKYNLNSQDVVAVLIDKSLEYMIALIAITKINCVYMAVGDNIPVERAKYMIENSNSKLILTTKLFDKQIDSDVNKVYIDLNDTNEIYIKNSEKNLDIKNKSSDIIHIIYTSGSTGVPKGNIILHKGILRLLMNTNFVDYTNNDTMLATGSITFDISGFETWGAMLYGMTLHFTPKEIILNPQNYEKYIIQNKITTAFIPTPLLNQYLEYNPKILCNFKSVYVGGDTFLPKYANIIYKYCKNTKVYNCYSPAENTVVCLAQLIDRKFINDVPLGKLGNNSVCYVVDKYQNLCPIGVPGDLYVGGEGLGLGYVNNDKLTKQRFIIPKFINKKLYKSGDLTYQNPDGSISFVERIDFQLKIRGQRVEIQEIENRMLMLKQIKEVVVKAYDDKNGSKYLVAYYTLNSNIDIEKIKEYLNKYLTSYMIPSKFLKLEKMPLNQNNKIDRTKLPFVELNDFVEYIPPKNKLQQKIVLIFEEVLGKDKVGMNDNFFDIGGDSILAINFTVCAKRENINIKYADIFAFPTPIQMYNFLTKKNNTEIQYENLNEYDYSKIDETLSKNNIESNDDKIEEKVGNILLTGVTGFLGAHILDKFFDNYNGKIYCLLRKKNNKSIKDRVKETLKFYFNDKYKYEIGKRIILIDGDITKDNLGINSLIYEEVVSKVDIVINSAAFVKHFGDKRLFYNINYNGVKNICDFCMRNNKKLIQISTLSVSGNAIEVARMQQIGDNITDFSENNLYVNQEISNIYVYTKYIAERYILNMIADGKLNAKIMRMGNLTSRYADGKFQINYKDNAFINRLKTFVNIGVISESIYNKYLEFTPIDYAALAIVKLLKSNYSHNVYHIYNSNHVQIKDFVDFLNSKGYNINIVSDAELSDTLNLYIKSENKNYLISGVIQDIDKNNRIDYNTNINIKSEFTKYILKNFDFEWPIIDQKYILKFINYFKSIGYFE